MFTSSATVSAEWSLNLRLNLDFCMPVCYNDANVVDYSAVSVTRLAKGGGRKADFTKSTDSRSEVCMIMS
jgi:hypothetical protein